MVVKYINSNSVSHVQNNRTQNFKCTKKTIVKMLSLHSSPIHQQPMFSPQRK